MEEPGCVKIRIPAASPGGCIEQGIYIQLNLPPGEGHKRNENPYAVEFSRKPEPPGNGKDHEKGDTMDILLFIVLAVIFGYISLRTLFTAEQLMDPPQYRPLNPEELDNFNVEKFEWYQTEAERQEFSLLGDFQLILGEIKDNKSKKGKRQLIRWERVLMDKPGTTFAIVSFSDLTGIVRLELVTYFDDGQQYISGNYIQHRRFELLPLGVTVKLYPDCCFEDLLTIHQEEVRRLSLSAKPISYPGFHTAQHEFVEKRVREFKNILDYNISQGVFVKGNREGYYQLSIKAGLRSFFKGASTSKPPGRDKHEDKAYRTGFTDPETSEKYRQKKIYRKLALIFGLVPAAAVVYKFFYMLPDPTGYFSLAWVSVVLWIGHGVFISQRLDRAVIFLYLVYYILSILGVYIILWNGKPNFLFVLPVFIMVGFGVSRKEGKSKPRSQKFVVSVLLAIILVMAFSLQKSLQFISRIHSLRSIDAQTVVSVGFYPFKPGEPFDIKTAKAETEITRPDRLAAFAASLSDMSPYLPNRDRMKGAYIVSITRTDKSVIFIPLGKGNRENPDAVYINFFTTGYIRRGSGWYNHGEYQSRKMYSFIESLDLEKWQNSEKTED